ncbi:MAG TPA: hypothetical protein VFF06_20635 [Polyangia bacterium]|nr:hypothetical protein [Polyangia bacterium]
MRRAVLFAALLACRAAFAGPAGRARIWFDARAPMARPMARVTVDGAPHAFLLDTGATHHVWSLERAQHVGALRDPAPPLLDFELREHDVERARVKVAVPELDLAFDGIDVSDWIEALQDRNPDVPHFDGVLSPHRLITGDEVLVIDLLKGEIAITDWPDARERLDDKSLIAAADAQFEDGHYLATAQIGAHVYRLAIDTGAPRTMVYAPRSLDTPRGMSRRRSHPARLVVGDLMRPLTVDVFEPLGAPDLDGVLGMDVLADCVMALDARRLELRCRGDKRDAHGDSTVSVLERDPMRPEYVCLEPNLCLRATAAGRFIYYGDRIAAEIDRDGNLRVVSLGGARPLAMRSTHDETRWLQDATALFRYQRGHERSLARSFEFLPLHLAAVWSDDRFSAAERREVLFKIWDEAAEPSDRELAAAGRRARRVIERFVRRRLPRGSPDGFADDELARLNARRADGPRFDPYRYQPSHDREDDEL